MRHQLCLFVSKPPKIKLNIVNLLTYVPMDPLVSLENSILNVLVFILVLQKVEKEPWFSMMHLCKEIMDRKKHSMS